jgi:hypothetical protein
MRRCAATLVVISMSVSLLSYAGTSPKVITAVRTTAPPLLDGFVNEPAWQAAPAVLDFTQFDPEEGGLPTEVTSVRVLYDDHALYVGVICYDSKPRQVVRQLTRRDRTSEADRFTVLVDSYHDHQTAFVFSSNVSGVQSDGVLSQDGTIYDITWDAVWNVKTQVYMDGWSLEFKIPYNALRFAEQEDGLYEWGINFRRYISRKHETDEWLMVPRREKLQVSKWGHIEGIRDIHPPLNLSLIPYVSSTSTFETATSAGPNSSDHKTAAGVDLKYGLSRNFTLDATFNPDFGQVEVDRAVLNLTVFETGYPEKRPFFIEGAQLFSYGVSIDNSPLPLFFSRRIGKRPTGAFSVSPPPGGTVEENPLVTTILGALKLTGHSQSGLSLGAIASATGEETAVVRDAAGNRTAVTTEPRGTYDVVRMKQDIRGNSYIGGMATLASRDHTLPAVSGGLDWNLRLAEDAYTFDGYVAGARSSTTAGPRDGSAGKLLFARIAAEHWLYTASFNFFSRAFNDNDIGLFNQPHDRGGSLEVDYRENFADAPLRRYTLAFSPQYRWNWDGIRTLALVEAGALLEFTNFWKTTFDYKVNLPAEDDAERGIIGTYQRPIAHAAKVEITTDERQNISAAFTPGYQFDERRKTSLSASLDLTVRPVSWVELTPMMYVERTRNEEAGVFQNGLIATGMLGGSVYSLFGDRDVDEFDFALRGIVTFARDLSLQFYTQILLARGRYQNYRLLVGSSEFLPQPAPSPGYDFNQIVFNANLLLRWEYLPGSELYLVWTQGRAGDSGDPSVGFGERFGDTFKLPHEDVVLLKMSYWLPF